VKVQVAKKRRVKMASEEKPTRIQQPAPKAPDEAIKAAREVANLLSQIADRANKLVGLAEESKEEEEKRKAIEAAEQLYRGVDNLLRQIASQTGKLIESAVADSEKKEKPQKIAKSEIEKAKKLYDEVVNLAMNIAAQYQDVLGRQKLTAIAAGRPKPIADWKKAAESAYGGRYAAGIEASGLEPNDPLGLGDLQPLFKRYEDKGIEDLRELVSVLMDKWDEMDAAYRAIGEITPPIPDVGPLPPPSVGGWRQHRPIPPEPVKPPPSRPTPGSSKGASPFPEGLLKWMGVVVILAAIMLACGCVLIFGGWKAWEYVQRPEPAVEAELATSTPTPQQPEQVAPIPEGEEVAPPTHTPTPTPTPTEAPPTEPSDVTFKAADDQELVGTYYPPPACPSPLTIVYFPWVHGDKGDWKELAALLPDDLPYGAFAITPRGCEGGCTEWDKSGWALDYVAALEAAKGLPCAGGSAVIAIGSSVGGDGAIYACAKEESCVGALSFSPSGYLDIPFAEEVETMVEQGKPVWSVCAQDDTAPAMWPFREDFDYGLCREIVIPGNEHGNELFNPGTGKIIQDFIECATHSFASEQCTAVLVQDHINKGNAHLEQAKEYFQEHDCEHWIPEAREAIRRCATALELNPNHAEAYFCRARGYIFVEEPVKAINDLERALEIGLRDEQETEARERLTELRESVAAPVCSIGPILFTEGWTASGDPINPSETCSDGITDEIRTIWELSGTCDQRFTVKWFYNGKLTCFHYYEPEEHELLEGSMYHMEGGQDLPGGVWTISVYVGGKEIGSASCEIP
jgi:tetratricopeptide (TPR) repeat protein